MYGVCVGVCRCVGGCMRVCAGVHACAEEGLGMCESVQGYMGVLEYGSGDYSPTFSGL